ncbi:DUF559 domain-containing protein [Hoyosella rhizosphaerae]|uniref:DUF559 domain-containing protein n=1 Tax=Hoyosella rhizosphaerae TaxID=1755582 RepID=A0A916U065_9ACTN|nr:DUF559 domain-containing protein [Hoyosella rhizosphaerae]GGC53086.1 hypothetical protein GCM10011410_01790 [Hoyosella rhizosphaerae]
MCVTTDVQPFKPSQRGVTRGELARYRRLLSGVYVDPQHEVTPLLKARAAWVWADGKCVLSGVSAAAVHGTRYLPNGAPEIVYRKAAAVTGLAVHRDRLRRSDITVKRQMRVTTPARTAFDLARRQPLYKAVAMVDALYQATYLTPKRLAKFAADNGGHRGIRALRSVIELSDDGAESPRETYLRLLIIQAGFPRPVTQHVVCDASGTFLGRADLAWPEWKVAVEYEGAHHFTDSRQARRDALRSNAFMRSGWRVIRVLNESTQHPSTLVAHIDETLRAAGWSGLTHVQKNA